jgi:hypothetical protein
MAITSGADLSVIEGRLTAARAGYIDNLSAGAVAQAGVFTATRAGYLDNLSAGAAALQSSVAAIPTASINKIIRVSTSISSGASISNSTISAVVLAKTVIMHKSVRSSYAIAIPADEMPFFGFTSTTNLKGGTYATVGVDILSEVWIVEYN